MKTCFILAGISGSSAIAMGAYGAHVLRGDKLNRETFKTANTYHLVNSFGILLSPLSRFPIIPASLFSAGITLFCGACYYTAITNDRKFNFIAPYGGTSLILAWASFALGPSKQLLSVIKRI